MVTVQSLQYVFLYVHNYSWYQFGTHTGLFIPNNSCHDITNHYIIVPSSSVPLPSPLAACVVAAVLCVQHMTEKSVIEHSEYRWCTYLVVMNICVNRAVSYLVTHSSLCWHSASRSMLFLTASAFFLSASFSCSASLPSCSCIRSLSLASSNSASMNLRWWNI